MADILPGTIVAYGGTEESLANLENLGWLLCDGKLYSNTNAKYKLLFAAIGVAWGGDGASKFAVPDLRGIFLRGITMNLGMDPDAANRNKSRPDLNSSGNGGNAVGSKQDDEIKSHTHNVTPNHAYMDNTTPATNGCEGGEDVHYTPRIITNTNTGGAETRPRNAYVYYIIKL